MKARAVSRALPVVLTVVAALMVGGCGDSGSKDSSAGKPLKVAANFYPVEEAAKQIGGSNVTVTDLTSVGAEPHDLELTPEKAAALSDASLVLYLSHDFQPSVEKAVAQLPQSTKAVDLLQGVKLRPASTGIPGVRGEVDGGPGEALAGGQDPHVWVDPARFSAMARKIQAAMIAADPSHRAQYVTNGDAYVAKLQSLASDFSESLASCKSKVLVTSHAAFGYIADRYGLTQAAIAGITPEAEPNPQSLAALAKYARSKGVKTVYFETLVPKRLSQTLANEIGAKTDALNPVEGLTAAEIKDGNDYISIQRDNLARLKSGLSCTG